MVKRLIAVSFLIVLLLPAVYKVGFFTYFQLNRDFIAANYCVNKDQPITMCYGQCFLIKGIQLADDVPNPDRLASTIKSEMPAASPEDFHLEFYFSQDIKDYSFLAAPDLSAGVASTIFRPPLG